MITYNSKLVMTVTKKNNEVHWIRAYAINNSSLHFEEEVKGKFIKFKEVE